MPPDIPTYVRNRSLGLGTSKSGSILPKPTAATQTPQFLDFSLENFEDRRIFQKDVVGHYGCINAIEFSPSEELVASGGDDRRVAIWATDELLYNKEPKMRGKMKRQHRANIFALAFDPESKVVYSAGNDHFFVSSDICTGAQLYGVQGDRGVHDISVNNRSGEILVTRSGGEDALLFLDTRTHRATASITANDGREPQLFSAQFNPDPSTFLIGICGENFGVRFIDRRNLVKPLFSRDFSQKRRSAMFGGWNRNGTKFAHLVARNAPVVYDFKECVAYETAPGTYKNAYTVKSIEWIDDDWLVTGSDNFNIYGWNTRNVSNLDDSLEVGQEPNTRFKFVEKEETDIVPKATLIGHRSIVNHVRFSSRYQFLVSSGVEKIIKVWNTRPFPSCYEKPRLRRRGTTDNFDDDGRKVAPRRRRPRNEERTKKKKTDESGRMLRYFDKLVAGELDTSDDDLDANSSEESLDDSDDDVRPGEQGMNRLVEDTDDRDGVENIPEMRVIINGGRSVPDSGGSRVYWARVHDMDSDSTYSDGVVDVTMSSLESDEEEESGQSYERRRNEAYERILELMRRSHGEDEEMSSPDHPPRSPTYSTSTEPSEPSEITDSRNEN